MPDEQYFAVINDNHTPTAPENDVCIPFCLDGAGNPIIVEEKEDALWLRDRTRDGYDNPAINVYRVTLHEEAIEREGDGGEA
ncbi:hypothetical protein [Halorarum salinum]|uniref:Uncharacterized protein n=1 Tax=Halorarum salinum TaxID=2743089 RepID=A0A7D5QBR4_9EURY|nr:hypothetical protein [Halobaculum salinum]QLG62060.1 hypothetical protein HUG12_10105 [Halobaculum salinum]